jgi:N-acetylglucosaminyldiphosphoundecaprenol N-acetyl-beta-D-mannosaminyltransferase
MKILGIRIDQIDQKTLIRNAEQFLYSSSQHTIFTPNPEFLVKAYKDTYFRQVLNSSEINICDGKGIQLISKVRLERITGADFIYQLCEIAQKLYKTIYLLGSGNDEIIESAVKKLKKEYSSLIIVGYNKGPDIKELPDGYLKIDSIENNKIIIDIQDKKPDILLVGFGMGKQEKWIYENLIKLPSIKIAMGVGGSFEFISGKIHRAPKWMRKIGLEWVYRLIKEPGRIKRIWNATVVFIWLIVKEGLKKKKNTVE